MTNLRISNVQFNMKKLQELIDGSAPLHKNTRVATGDYFKRRKYKEIAPY